MKSDPLYSFRLPRLLLRALSLFQASADRPSLACTRAEIQAHGDRHELTLVATDGRRFASYSTPIQQETLFGAIPGSDAFTLDLAGMARLPKPTDTTFGDSVELEVYRSQVEIAAGAIRYTAARQEKDINFPAWRAIIPSGQPESLTQFAVNPDLLADFGRTAKWLFPKNPTLALRSFGEGRPIAVMLPGDSCFFGLIMPLRFESPEQLPEWLRELQPSAEPAAA